MKKMPSLAQLPELLVALQGRHPTSLNTKSTPGLRREAVGKDICDGLTTYPRDFHIHPKIKKLLEQRAEMGQGKRAFRLWHGGSCGLRFAADCRALRCASAGRTASAAPLTSVTAC